MSVTKPLVGCVAAALAGRGILDPAAPLTAYVPELAASGYAGATVRHVLDMRSGVIFSEDYLDPGSEIRRLEQCIGWSPPADATQPDSIYNFLAALRQGSDHGGPFAYRSAETDALGWACERAAGARMPELMSDLVWGRLGAEHDADISLDRVGVAVHDGGMSAALRDLARFGQMLADGGRSMTGQQVLPPGWVQDTLIGDPGSRAAFAASPTDTGMPGGMYRNTFWVPYRGFPSSSGRCTARRYWPTSACSWPFRPVPIALARARSSMATPTWRRCGRCASSKTCSPPNAAGVQRRAGRPQRPCGNETTLTTPGASAVSGQALRLARRSPDDR
jgi:CubicO group peptidase (beta-lactamase class C family)